jgi:hypothetical protein
MQHLGKRLVLAGLAALVALTAIPSAFLVIPELPLEWLARGPFTDYTIPALALGIPVGGSAVVAAIGAFLRPGIAATTSALAGLMIVGYELVEIAIVGFALLTYGPEFLPAWLQVVYVAVGIAQIAVAYWLWRGSQLRHAPMSAVHQ